MGHRMIRLVCAVHKVPVCRDSARAFSKYDNIHWFYVVGLGAAFQLN